MADSAEKDAGCGHPNHGNADHNCASFVSAGKDAARIDHLLAGWMAGTQVLAEQSRDDSGGIHCCVCGSRDDLVCVGRGWGGVYACRACDTETRPS